MSGTLTLDASPLGQLERFGAAPALVTAEGGVLSHADLTDRVRERVDRLGAGPRLVLVECRNDVETVVSYLAALRGRHPVLLAEPGRSADLTDRYRPDALARGADLELCGPGDRAVHPDLAVLLSTSGSTGSPKLVRLSRENVSSNARSIAGYLRLTEDDRAATTLPLQYCYGLSVLNSHLLVGASLLLTDHSVVEERFWDHFARAGATSFAGVPHTFDLLDASGFDRRTLPTTLRTITQAGGRLPAEKVRRYAELGRRSGFELVVMYGQTEATARMAYLPPHLAVDRPDAIGIPIPGGSLRVEPCGHPDPEVGELVYTGPNVMLGYAETPSDLGLGRTVHELRTGDLGRQCEDDLFEVVGRRSRFAKVFGLRLDLDGLEERLRATHVEAHVVEHEDRLHVFVSRPRDGRSVEALVADLGLPPHAVGVHVLARLPLTAPGKPDRAALSRHLSAVSTSEQGKGHVTPERVRDVFAHLLGRPDATVGDSFGDLHGDSLSYVEASLRLGRMLPELPEDWSKRSAVELAAVGDARATSEALVPVETSVLLRALAIVLVVGSHANLLSVLGGAHVLLAVAGFNIARFQLSGLPRCGRRRSLFRAAAAIALPAALWIGGVTIVAGTYDTPTALMLNNLLGPAEWDDRWQFWFLEALVWVLVGAGLLLSLHRVDRLERAFPFAFATVACVAALTLRYALVGIEAGHPERYALPVVLWTVGLGWMAARADTDRLRVLTSAVAVLACWGFFGDPVREALVAAGVCLLIWLPRVTVPGFAVPLLSALAGSSLFVYLTHWQVYPHLEVDHPFWATTSSFVVGYAAWRCWVRADVLGFLRSRLRLPLSPRRRCLT